MVFPSWKHENGCQKKAVLPVCNVNIQKQIVGSKHIAIKIIIMSLLDGNGNVSKFLLAMSFCFEAVLGKKKYFRISAESQMICYRL